MVSWYQVKIQVKELKLFTCIYFQINKRVSISKPLCSYNRGAGDGHARAAGGPVRVQQSAAAARAATLPGAPAVAALHLDVH